MKKQKKMLSGMLAAALVLGMGTTNVTAEEVMYPMEEVTLTLAMVGKTDENLFELPLGTAWQEATGVKVELLQCTSQDALNLLIAGGDLPDLIYFNPSTYSGGQKKQSRMV